VVVVRFAAALLKASLIACPAVFSEATAIREIKTRSKAYSVKSWPSSSLHSILRICIGVSLHSLEFEPYQLQGTQDRVNYVVVVRFAAALLKASLIACPAVFSEATAIREIKTRSKAYSVKSWPSSSFHNLFIVSIIYPADRNVRSQLNLCRLGLGRW